MVQVRVQFKSELKFSSHPGFPPTQEYQMITLSGDPLMSLDKDTTGELLIELSFETKHEKVMDEMI